MNKMLDKNCQMKDSEIEWIGKIPKGWEVRRFSSCISKSNAGEVIPKEFWGKGCELLYTCAKEPLFSNYEGFPEDKRTQKGDLLLTRNGTPYIHMPKLNSIYSNVVQRVILEKDNSSFIRYTLIQGSKSIIGNGDIIESFNMGKWNSTSIPLPPLYEQQAIANYLDEQIEKIDELIAEQNQAIENWNTYKQSLITEKVTKGLNPSVEMKDSGIEWIGEIPNDWNLARVKDVSYCLDAKRVPISAEMRTTGNIPYWGAGNIVDYIDRYIFNEELVLLGEDGAPFMDKDRPVAFYINSPIWANNHIHVLRNKENIKAKYLTYSLNCVDYYPFIGGSIIPKLTQSSMKEIKLPLPSLQQQQAIVDYLDEKCLKIDQMIEQKQVLINQLEEYKQSLIYECVTGKRCVL